MCVIGKKGSKATALKEPKSCNESSHLRASVPFRDPLVAQMVKNLPVMQETWVQSLGWEDPLEESMGTHSSILAWRIPMDRGAWWATDHWVTNTQTQLK